MISTLLRISWCKTIRFNFRYFDLETAFKFPVLVARNMRIRSLKGKVDLLGTIKPGIIRLGFGDMGHFDARDVRGIWDNRGIVSFEGAAYLGLGTCISVNPSAKLKLGEEFNITAKSTILVEKEISFGKGCLLSWDILVMDTDFHPIYDKDGVHLNAPKAVVVEDNVWVGCQSLILKGAIVPSGAIIGAGSKVSGPLSTPNSVYVGEPLKVVRSEVRWGY